MIKKSFLTICSIILFALTLSAQTVNEGFAGYGTISGISLVSGSTYNFTISSFNGNIRPFGRDAYAIADMAIGDIIWSTDCNKFVIASINTGTGVGTFTNPDPTNQTVPTNSTRVAVLREYTNGNITKVSLPPSGDGNSGAISGITIALKECILTHYRARDSIANIRTLSLSGQNLTLSGPGGNTVTLPTGSASNLSYNASTRVVSNSNGTGFTIPFVVGTDNTSNGTPGLVSLPTPTSYNKPLFGSGQYQDLMNVWASSQKYNQNDFVYHPTTNEIFRRVSQGTSLSTFALDSANWAKHSVTTSSGGGGAPQPQLTVSLNTYVTSTLSTYGFIAAHATSGFIGRANTSNVDSLPQFYITSYVGTVAKLESAGIVTVTASFSYTVGQMYYLQDDGTLATSADSNGSAQDYDTAVCYVIASLGGGQYMIALKDPRHFAG